MSTKLNVTRPIPLADRSSVRRGRPARREVPSPQSSKPSGPRILDAVKDQRSGRWIRYGTDEESAWFSLSDLITNAAEVYTRLSDAAVPCLSRSSQERLKRDIDGHSSYRPALIASHPGWVEHFYVFGDGTVVSPPGDNREVIVAFELDPKFEPRGTLKDWQRTIGPTVANQSLPLFSLSYAGVGSILRFAPPGYLNPEVEFVGERESGKSTLGVLAASVWAGNLESDIGGGESWDATVNSFDDMKLQHSDCLCFLDERNLIESPEVAKKAVFKFARTGQKRRKGDSKRGEHARTAILSTSNEALAESLAASPDIIAAAESRMVTIRVGGSTGVFDFIPDGFPSARAAVEQLHQAAYDNYGEPGREFIRWLVAEAARDEEGLKRYIKELLDWYMSLKEAKETASARTSKIFAITAAAGVLAWDAGVLPGKRQAIVEAVRQVHRLAIQDQAPQPRQHSPIKRHTPMKRVERYVQQHREDLIEVSRLKAPLTPKEFEAAAGFVRQRGGHREVLIPSARFQRAFPDFRPMMQELRDAGQVRTEGGKDPKLTIKAPNSICRSGRVYCIRLGEQKES